MLQFDLVKLLLVADLDLIEDERVHDLAIAADGAVPEDDTVANFGLVANFYVAADHGLLDRAAVSDLRQPAAIRMEHDGALLDGDVRLLAGLLEGVESGRVVEVVRSLLEEPVVQLVLALG